MSDITLGIIGGGQLGSLLSVAANKLNINTVIFSDDKNSPAKNFTKNFISGNYDDEKLIKEFLSKVNVITYEFENIPYKILKKLNEIKPVLPKPEINKLIQNRYTEKDFLNKNNIRTTRYSLIKDEDDIKINDGLIPGLLKTCTLGYDGKGQFKIDKKENISSEIDFTKEYILEKFVKLKKEISVIITRFGHQRYEIYEPIENLHEDQILKHSKIPAQISEKIKNQATNWATIIAEELDYVGTLCVEYFIDNKDNLYANEIAPRVHNSGHLTINSHNVSQFENHIRAVCGLEKVETKKIYNARMLNLIGNDIEDYRVKSFKDNEFFFDYQKTEIREKRKMGHFTIIEKEN
ncbi:5-(carboxyamino)imidazole ribonucleotide synthase [Candidatus Pelagibacter sp. RS40]|jgi:5-(carboxyamino)imidazole ribonucleotide synthase|uniref:5-(carboxyamino)imidazole ribonucleotide synthase n=1 Tax=Candidatus Pelagibacter sp. RS40 TaxID=1977865 RepID=UPI000A15FA79|nr:5-(carboxyamino)imidazole ribonucleotide synthase [Candidatus Pelagibacter sp. RS40]ARJ49471.1 5-(carboxyamino)imidazole ribonucleotide synthase [Candidatus Pelagibacter sp. RS40]|tara:strand:+ start:914 stop:1963 length:1050 start_codon:yes stop_codon:yes gene_type:complete